MEPENSTESLTKTIIEEQSTKEEAQLGGVVVDDTFIEKETLLKYDEKEESRIRMKIDIKIIPWVGLMYFLSFLDRVNIGNARVVNSDAKGVGEFDRDLGLSATDFNWAISIFFIGYVLFEVPSNLLLKKLLPSRWLSRIMVSWGICATCLAAVNNFPSVLIVRYLLGVMEAGLFPGVLFYLSFWYRKHELARRMSWFIAAASGSGAFSGVFAFGIAQISGAWGIKGWQWVFIIEGIPTVIIGVITWFYLPDFPTTAKFLNERERLVANARLKQDHIDADEKDFSMEQFKAAITDLKVWGWMFAYIGFVTPLYSLSFFIPTLIRSMGFSSLQAQLMSSPPFLAAVLVNVIGGFTSDYFKDRSSHVLLGAVSGAISFFLLSVVRTVPVLYFLTVLVTASVYLIIPTILSWVANNMVGSTKGATAMAMVVGFGNIGGLIAGQIYRSVEAPWYQIGHTINGCCCIWAFIWALTVRLYIVRLNSQMDQAEQEDVTEKKETVPGFRYQL